MWLINSPIGRKVVMSLTGICLILFLTFHCCMNIAAFFREKPIMWYVNFWEVTGMRLLEQWLSLP